MAKGPATAWREVDALAQDDHLSGCWCLPAIWADLLRRLGRHREAAVTYRQATHLADNEAERDFLAGRLAETGQR